MATSSVSIHAINTTIGINLTNEISNSTTTTITVAALPFTLFLSFVGITLNGIISYTIIRRQTLHIPTYIFICNMSISDIIALTGLIIYAFMTAVAAGNSTYSEFLEVGCKGSVFLINVSFSVSTISLAVISIDRYLVVTGQSDRQSTNINKRLKRKIQLIIMACWIYAISISGPIIPFLYVPRDGSFVCDTRNFGPNYNVPFMMLYYVLNYLIPLIIMVVMYLKIIRFLFIKTATINEASQIFIINRRRTNNVIKMMVIVTFTYMLSSLPYILILISSSFSGLSLTKYIESADPLSQFIIRFGLVLITISPIQNPIVYLCYNDTLREALPTCLTCRSIGIHKRRQTMSTSIKVLSISNEL